MLKNHLTHQIKKNLGFEPTPHQSIAINKLADFITQEKNNEIFLLKGYAGTGKTTLMSVLTTTLTELKIGTVLLAPTGRAAKVLSNYANKPAYTIHKKIYRQKSRAEDIAVFNLDRNLHKNTIFIVDEASMISNFSLDSSPFGSGCLLDDLVNYVYSGNNCRLILIGDTAQLPPVGLDISPALDVEELRASYNFEIQQMELTQVVRQSEKSGILSNATLLREMLQQDCDSYPLLNIEKYKDIIRLNGADLIEEIQSAYYNFGVEDTIVVTRSNKRANQFNQGIRNTVLYREDEIAVGDLLMVVKNNYYWAETVKEIDFIANGDIVELVRIRKYTDLYGFRFAEVTIRFPDNNNIELDTLILLDTLNIESAALTRNDLKRLFFAIEEDYIDIRNKKQRYEKILNNKFFNALQVKFAYAVTCHKAQGGQWSSVFVDQGYVIDDMLNREFFRWLYTAFTRASEKLYLVNFNKDFFDDKE